MNQLIRAVSAVSDGILVEFQGGVRCYFAGDFLLNHVNRGSNLVFLDYDPTPAIPFELPEFPVFTGRTQ